MKYDYNPKTYRLKPTLDVINLMADLRNCFDEDRLTVGDIDVIIDLLQQSLKVIESSFDPIIVVDTKLLELLSPVMFNTSNDEVSSIQLENPSTPNDGPEAA